MARQAVESNVAARRPAVHSLDEAAIRRDFPVLDRIVNGHRLVYLDNAATSQKPLQVLEALDSYYREYNSNVHRGIHKLSQEATERFEEARVKVATFLGVKSPRETIFVRNTTEAINLVARSWGDKHLRPGDEILVTEMEHHSNIVPWQLVAQRTGAILKYVPIVDHSRPLGAEDFQRAISPRTRLVATTQMSNVLGTITPIKEIARLAHDNGALLLVDGAQSAPHMRVNIEELECDFFACSGHKMLGPTGIGVLFGREEILKEMDPFMGGGDMISIVRMEGSTWNELPYKFEAGTPDIADAIALGAAVDYLDALGMDSVRRHERELTAYALEAVASVRDVILYGPADPDSRGGVISFNLADVHPHDLGQVLDGEGIAIRAGHHCAQPLMRCLGVGSTARASFYIYNTKAEVDVLVGALHRARKFFN